MFSLLRRLVKIPSASRSFSNEKFIVNSKFPQIDIPTGSLCELVFRNVDVWPNHVAVECGTSGRKYTYDQLRAKIDCFASSARKKLNLKSGDVVSLMMPNIPEYPIVVFGCIRLGVTFTTINVKNKQIEVFNQLKSTASNVIVTVDYLVPLVESAASTLTNPVKIIAVKTDPGNVLKANVLDLKDFTEEKEKISFSSRAEVACLLYSSGTTGVPKGTELSESNLLAATAQIVNSEANFLHFATPSHQDVIPAVLPFFHIYGLMIMCWSFSCGAKLITLPSFTPEKYISVLKKEKPSVLMIVPPIANESSIQKEHLSRVRVAISGAAPLGPSDEEKFLKKAKSASFIQIYGLSETAALTLRRTSDVNCAGSIGHPAPNTSVKVVTLEDSKPCGPKEIGELLTRGPQIMRRYFNNEKATLEAFDEDGWFKTGDLVYYDENGFFYVVDRIKEMIKVNAFPVAPAELEEILRCHEDVSDAAVVGIPHGKYGEVPRGYVVLKNGKRVEEREILDFVESKVASHKKLIGGVEFVREIPKNPSGKILRRVLREKCFK